MKRLFIIIVLILSMSAFSSAATNDEMGKGFSVELTIGIQGIMSFFQVGINLPQYIDNFAIGAKFRLMSSLTWATFTDLRTNETVSCHPVCVSGILSLGGTNEMANGFMRPYGATELLIGYSFTPYDSYFYNKGNLIGKNLTYGIFGYFGLELFSSEQRSTIFESGGGYKGIKVDDKENQYAVAYSWLGSGLTSRMGTRFYAK
ncbi:hypothetical protein ACFL4K_01745 [Candidatus Neomarinimicrobiota bacterium]